LIFVSFALFLSVAAAQSAPILPVYGQSQGSVMYFFDNVHMRGTTASYTLSYDLEIGMEYASIQMIDTTIQADFYAMFNEGRSYLVTSVDGENANCQVFEVNEQPIPSPNILDTQGHYVGNALVGNLQTSHWQMDSVEYDESKLKVDSDFYFLTATMNVPSLPIRQVSQCYTNESYLGLMIMDMTASSISKPPSDVCSICKK